jgi:glycosyltransferase involved in cell wall biosynthesis
MRVAVVTTSFPSGDRDPSGHFVQAEVAELERAGAEVTVVTPRPGGAFGWPGAAVRLRERPWRAFEAAAWVARASAEVRAVRPDRIVAHWSVPCAWPIAAAAAGDVDLDVVSHGGDVRLLVGMPAPARARIVRAIASRASRWRFVSARLRDELVGCCRGSEGEALERVAVVAPSTLTMIDVREEAAARRRSFADRRLYVCAGRLVASKRVDRVIDYVASASGERRRDRVLIVVGDGPERPRLEELARRWGMDVRFLGTRSRRETLTWLGAADEIVHASRAEGLSTVVREAEHLGVPVTILT